MKIILFTTFFNTDLQQGYQFLHLFFSQCLPSLYHQSFSDWELHLFIHFQLHSSIISYLEQYELPQIHIHYINQEQEWVQLSDIICSSQTNEYASCILSYYQSISPQLFNIIQPYSLLKHHIISFSSYLGYEPDTQKWISKKLSNKFLFAIQQNIYSLHSSNDSDQLNENFEFLNQQSIINHSYENAIGDGQYILIGASN